MTTSDIVDPVMILSLSLYLSIFLSLCLSLPVFNSEVSLDPSWRNGIRDERSVRLRRLSLALSELTKPVDYWKSMVLREWRAKWVYNVEKSRNRSKELEKGKGEIGWRRSRGRGKCIKSLGDGKLKKVSRFVGRRDFCERACVCVCVWKYEELYGRVWQKS